MTKIRLLIIMIFVAGLILGGLLLISKGTALEPSPPSAPPPSAERPIEEPQACIELYDPVCGSDGRTYSNDCFARVAGATVAYQGACVPEPSNPPEGQSPSSPPPQSVPPPPPPPPQPQVREFRVTAKQWEFTPATITVQRGDMVKLRIESIDVTHGFAIPELDVNKSLTPGQTTTVEFVADQQGTFSFFCSVFCGSGHATMRGQLVVE